MITDEAAKVITDVFKNRWRTLMSVDDVIGAVHGLCTDLNIIDNTYFFYSSDHGFQLGEFNIPMDKRHAYDWDTHIHLLAAGPGIKAGSTWDQPATQVQFSPLFLALDLALPLSPCGILIHTPPPTPTLRVRTLGGPCPHIPWVGWTGQTKRDGR